MTRGTFYLITDKYIIESIEFNGDMYPDGHGIDAIKMLSDISNLKDFKVMLKEFNRTRHKYESGLTFPAKREKFIIENNTIDFNDDYYGRFFSDWTFWKNVSSNPIIFLTTDNKKIVLNPHGDVAINFGNYERHYNSDTKPEDIE